MIAGEPDALTRLLMWSVTKWRQHRALNGEVLPPPPPSPPRPRHQVNKAELAVFVAARRPRNGRITLH